MKRFLQVVAVCAICLIAVQPILAAAPCMGNAPASCASGCPMAMDGMGPDCPMAGMATASACPQSCCAQLSAQVLVVFAAPSQSKLVLPALSGAVAEAPRAGAQATSPVHVEAHIASPPLYILNQVFRI